MEEYWIYLFSGVCNAIVGMSNTPRLVAVYPASGESWGMNAIGSAVLGGISMEGGISSGGLLQLSREGIIGQNPARFLTRIEKGDSLYLAAARFGMAYSEQGPNTSPV